MEKMTTVCKSPWCKATFFYTEDDMVLLNPNSRTSKIDNLLDETEKIPPRVCPKCKSFDTELSGGVNWSDKEYEGSRFDGTPHQLKYKVTNYKL
jgi:hypothetical protein